MNRPINSWNRVSAYGFSHGYSESRVSADRTATLRKVSGSYHVRFDGGCSREFHTLMLARDFLDSFGGELIIGNRYAFTS